MHLYSLGGTSSTCEHGWFFFPWKALIPPLQTVVIVLLALFCSAQPSFTSIAVTGANTGSSFGAPVSVLMPRTSDMNVCPAYGTPLQDFSTQIRVAVAVPTGACGSFSYSFYAVSAGSLPGLAGLIAADIALNGNGYNSLAMDADGGSVVRAVITNDVSPLSFTSAPSCGQDTLGLFTTLDVNRDTVRLPEIVNLAPDVSGNSVVTCYTANTCAACSVPGPWNAGLVARNPMVVVSAPLQGNGLQHLIVEQANSQLWIQNAFGAGAGFTTPATASLFLRLGTYVAANADTTYANTDNTVIPAVRTRVVLDCAVPVIRSMMHDGCCAFLCAHVRVHVYISCACACSLACSLACVLARLLAWLRSRSPNYIISRAGL